jgi:hypothetical protein
MVERANDKKAQSLTRTAVEMIRESLAAGGSITVQINSSSMTPWVVPGDEVEFKAPDFRLLPGAVVLAIRRRGPLTHRIVAVESGRYLLKGDAVPRFDGWFSRDRIIACGVAVKRADRVLRTVSFPYRIRSLIAALFSCCQGFIWPGFPLEGVGGLAGRAVFYIYKISLALLFFRFKL